MQGIIKILKGIYELLKGFMWNNLWQDCIESSRHSCSVNLSNVIKIKKKIKTIKPKNVTPQKK